LGYSRRESSSNRGIGIILWQASGEDFAIATFNRIGFLSTGSRATSCNWPAPGATRIYLDEKPHPVVEDRLDRHFERSLTFAIADFKSPRFALA
jgi:hypothetical protein